MTMRLPAMIPTQISETKWLRNRESINFYSVLITATRHALRNTEGEPCRLCRLSWKILTSQNFWCTKDCFSWQVWYNSTHNSLNLWAISASWEWRLMMRVTQTGELAKMSSWICTTIRMICSKHNGYSKSGRVPKIERWMVWCVSDNQRMNTNLAMLKGCDPKLRKS